MITKIKMQALLLLMFLDRSLQSPQTRISGVVWSLRAPRPESPVVFKAEIKIKLKQVLLHLIMIKAHLMVKARTRTVVMTK